MCLTALRMSVARSDEQVHPIGRALDPLVRGRFAARELFILYNASLIRMRRRYIVKISL